MFTWNCNKRRRMLYKMTVGVFSLQQKNTILGATIVIAHKHTRIWHNDIMEDIMSHRNKKKPLRTPDTSMIISPHALKAFLKRFISWVTFMSSFSSPAFPQHPPSIVSISHYQTFCHKVSHLARIFFMSFSRRKKLKKLQLKDT